MCVCVCACVRACVCVCVCGLGNVTQTRAYNDSRQREIRPGEIRQSELRPSENKQSENRLNETPPLLLYPNQFLLVSKSPQCHYTAFTSDWRLLTLSLFRASNWL